ncbi:DUF1883 domain-containing protein [Glutamicibacter endophyticus]
MTERKFAEYHWKHLERGSTLVITLSRPANVRLMDPENFAAFEDGVEYSARESVARKAPFRLRVPSSGPWFLVIDLEGLGGPLVRHSVHVEHRAVPSQRP